MAGRPWGFESPLSHHPDEKRMKAGITELSETRRRLDVEVPAADVDAAIDRLTRRRRGRTRVPGFRPGKVPLNIVRQRFRDDILHDAASDLVPEAVEKALEESGLNTVAAPDVRDVSIEEGRPLTFHALFEVLPTVGEFDYEALTLRRRPVVPDAGAEENALEQLRLRASPVVPVTDRPLATGDLAVLDLARRAAGDDGQPPAGDEHRERATVELGAEGNPPGLDAELAGLSVGDSKTFELAYPEGSLPAEFAGRRVTHAVTVREHRRRELRALDDEFAKSVGDFDSLAALKSRIADDLRHEAELETRRSVRRDLLRQLGHRLKVEIPDALVDLEVTRRLNDVAASMARQGADPRTAGIDWDALREEQRGPALEAVRSALALDEVARREGLGVGDEEVDRELTQLAERLGQTPDAVRARLERDGGGARLQQSLLREKAIDLLLSRATIVTA